MTSYSPMFLSFCLSPFITQPALMKMVVFLAYKNEARPLETLLEIKSEPTTAYPGTM